MALELTECKEDAAWDAFVQASPQGNVFCQSAFLAALGVNARRYLVTENSNARLAAVVLERDGAALQAPYPFTMYQGVLLAADLAALPAHKSVPAALELNDFLLAELAARWNSISFCLHPTFPDLRSFLWLNYHEPDKGLFRVDLRYTGSLDLQSSIPPSQQMRSVRRQEHRRATEAGLRCESSDDLQTLDRLHELTFQRQGIERPATEVQLLRDISAAALKYGFGKCFVARLADGQVASASLFLHDARTAYYLVGANDPAHRKSGSGVFLLAETIEHYRQAGQQSVDFVGVNSPNRGDFKTSFGARPVPYFEVTWKKP
jgi:hypothetical protein